MPTLIAEEQARIEAAPELVLEILRDFRVHHRHILPPAFSDFVVLEGGVGAGTVTSFTTNLGGRRIPGRTVVSEPAEGLIREEVVGRNMATTFRVVPDGDGSRVTIRTMWTPEGGLDGLLERLFAPRLLGRIYRDELRLLARYAVEVRSFRAAAGLRPSSMAGAVA